MKVYISVKRDEMILSTIAVLVVGGLIYLGAISLWDSTTYIIFSPNQQHGISAK